MLCTKILLHYIMKGDFTVQVKIAEFVGESHKDWSDAVKNAVEDASRSYDNITGIEVYNWTANCQDNKIVEYKANIKIAFTE